MGRRLFVLHDVLNVSQCRQVVAIVQMSNL